MYGLWERSENRFEGGGTGMSELMVGVLIGIMISFAVRNLSNGKKMAIKGYPVVYEDKEEGESND